MSDHRCSSPSPSPSPHYSAYIATTETILTIPRAQDWCKDMPIYLENDSSSVLFRVLENLNRGTTIEPNFRTIITDALGNQVLCLLLYNRKSFFPHWCLHLTTTVTSCPRRSNSGQLTSGERDQLPPNMILYGILDNTGQFKTRKCMAHSRHGDDNDLEELHYRYRSVCGGKLLCGFAGSSRRVIEVFNAESSTLAFVRNQGNETMTVAKGENLLVAAGLAYALDRRHKPLGSKAERLERTQQAHQQAVILGFKGPRQPLSSGKDNIVVRHEREKWHIAEQSESASAPLTTMSPTNKAVSKRAPRTRRKRQFWTPML